MKIGTFGGRELNNLQDPRILYFVTIMFCGVWLSWKLRRETFQNGLVCANLEKGNTRVYVANTASDASDASPTAAI